MVKFMDKVTEVKIPGYFRSTERSLTNYEEPFNFTPDQLKTGAVILDIGSGTYQAFARDLNQTRPDITVISVDPTLLMSKYDTQDPTDQQIRPVTEEEKQERRKNKFGNTVAAMAPDLPFTDGSFDYVFDNHSAFIYFPDNLAILKDYLSELIRITKPAGQINIFPLDLYIDALIADPRERFSKTIERITTLSKELGIEDSCELFTYTEELSLKLSITSLPRLGIKIKK